MLFGYCLVAILAGSGFSFALDNGVSTSPEAIAEIKNVIDAYLAALTNVGADLNSADLVKFRITVEPYKISDTVHRYILLSDVLPLGGPPLPPSYIIPYVYTDVKSFLQKSAYFSSIF